MLQKQLNYSGLGTMHVGGGGFFRQGLAAAGPTLDARWNESNGIFLAESLAVNLESAPYWQVKRLYPYFGSVAIPGCQETNDICSQGIV